MNTSMQSWIAQGRIYYIMSYKKQLEQHALRMTTHINYVESGHQNISMLNGTAIILVLQAVNRK